MSDKFKDLPVGTKVEVDVEKLKEVNINLRKWSEFPNVMTIIKPYRCLGYLTEEYESFEKDTWFLRKTYIKRVISYPIDRDKLAPSVKVKIREDLEVDKYYGSERWYREDTPSLGKTFEIIEIIPGVGASIVCRLDNGEKENFSVEMLEKIIEEPQNDHIVDLNKTIDIVNDPVNHPSHYTFGKYEVIDVIEDWGLCYHLGNSAKYIARSGKKDPTKTIEDLKKARFYLDRKITLLESEEETNG